VVAVDRLWEHIPTVGLMVVENKHCETVGEDVDEIDSLCVNSNDCMSSDNVCVSNAVNVVKSRATNRQGVYSDRIYLETYRSDLHYGRKCVPFN
ncbi:hypothetical protein Tco_0346719, partial [Tanacetum coccineum]